MRPGRTFKITDHPLTVKRRDLFSVSRVALFSKRAPKRCSIAAGLPAFHKSGAKPAIKPGGLNVAQQAPALDGCRTALVGTFRLRFQSHLQTQLISRSDDLPICIQLSVALIDAIPFRLSGVGPYDPRLPWAFMGEFLTHRLSWNGQTLRNRSVGGPCTRSFKEIEDSV
jgi:hypothetical protein